MSYTVTIPGHGALSAACGENLLELLRRHGFAPESPCGGNGTCRKCRVSINGEEMLSCQYSVTHDITVILPEKSDKTSILEHGCAIHVESDPVNSGLLLAFDIGTTTVVAYLMRPDGTELAGASMLNPQSPFGADVISRIQLALKGEMDALTAAIRTGLERLTAEVCEKASVSPAEIGVVSVVANPCMQQLFMDIKPKNLASVPFSPAITRTEQRRAADFLPIWENAVFLVVPDISGYVGADTVGCVLATRLYEAKDTALLVDIGTKGEMVLIHNGRMAACSTAAGPALEGAKIRFGMRGAPGAIDHVWFENGTLRYSVIGGGEGKGICGSGLIDAAAAFLEHGDINERGRVQRLEELDGERILRLSENVYLTQTDIREMQMAKGAIAAGIALMAEQLGTAIGEIDRVLLAGAFGSFIRPESACRIGLLPPELTGRITAVGNAAGSGAKMAALSRREFERTNELVSKIEFLELAALEDFQDSFIENLDFPDMQA